MTASKMLFLLFCLAALSIQTCSAQSNILLNGSFAELGRYWDIDNGCTFSALNCPDNDMYCLGSGSPFTIIYQEVKLPSCIYNLDFSAFYRMMYLADSYPFGDLGSVISVNPGQAMGYLVVDGEEVCSAERIGSNSISKGLHDTGWINSAYSWTGYVASTVGVRIVITGTKITFSEGQGSWGSYVDAVSLNATPVPEPNSLLVLGIGFLLYVAILLRPTNKAPQSW